MESVQILLSVLGVLAGLVVFVALCLWNRRTNRNHELAKKRRIAEAARLHSQFELDARRLKLQTINKIRATTNSEGVWK